MRDLARVPAILERLRLDGWLLYDFRGQNPTALEVLGLPHAHLSRRFFAYVDRSGLTLLLHAIEQQPFEGIAGRRRVYAGRERLVAELAAMLAGARRVAMEYCPMGAIPTLSRVDGGTLELVRSLGVEIASSADLVQEVVCVLTPEQMASHVRASHLIHDAKDAAFARIAAAHARGDTPLEHEIQAFLMERFDAGGLQTDHPPIVAAGAHAGNPHYRPDPSRPAPIGRDQLVLIDLWAKERRADAVYADITWTAFTGAAVPARIAEVFDAVAGGRDAGLALVRARKARRQRLAGFEVDAAVRAHIAARGMGEHFIHRTGHNIGTASAHGDGANVDDFETRDERELLDGTCFSIEPGVYLPEFGIRSEIDVLLRRDGTPEVHTPIQREVVRLLP